MKYLLSRLAMFTMLVVVVLLFILASGLAFYLLLYMPAQVGDYVRVEYGNGYGWAAWGGLSFIMFFIGFLITELFE